MGGSIVDEVEKATHVVTDRNPEHIKKLKNKEYIQPQWVCDCLNNQVLLPVADYAPGKILPPHLSPFVDNEKEGYVPERQKEIDQLKGVEQEDGSEIEEEI